MATFIVAAALAALVGLIIWRMLKDKKAGKTSCGGGCNGCAMKGKCGG